MATCPVCQHALLPTEDICEHCGAVLQSFAVTTPPVLTTPPTPTSPPSPQLMTGTVLQQKYKVLKALASGGMGMVYLAEDVVLKRQVVLKTLLSEADPELVEQSVKEREFLATLKHANIVSIYDFVTLGTSSYIVMEYVQGKTLEELLEEQGRPFTVEQAVRYMLAILPAFSYLMKLGLVYCDFKPQNLMLERLKDGSQVVKLIDLGTVIRYAPQHGAVYGTHGFYAPEAVKNPSPQTDLYSICRTLAYLITLMDLNRPVFGLPPAEEYKTFREYPPLYRLLARGTHNQPERRFQSAEQLFEQMAGVLRLITGETATVASSPRRFVNGGMTTTGKVGLRAEAALDEHDKAIALLRLGDQALRVGNLTAAFRLYKQSAGANPRSVDAPLRMAEVQIEQGHYDKAKAEIGSVQRIAPNHWKIFWYIGRWLEAQSRLSEAAQQYRQLMDELPGELPPLLALARVYIAQGDDKGAIELYKILLKADSTNSELCLNLAHAYIRQKRWDEAVKVLSGIGATAQCYVEAQFLLCDLYLEKIQPLTHQNVLRAAEVLQGLVAHTKDTRLFLARAQVYHTAWQLARERRFPRGTTMAGVPNVEVKTLSRAAEEHYIQYLRHEPQADERESIIRRRHAVASWRLW